MGVQLGLDRPALKAQDRVWILLPVFYAPEMVILRDNFVQSKDNSFDIIPLGKAAGLADTSSTVEVKEKEVVCFGIDEEIPRGYVLMHDSELEIEVVYHV